MPNIALPSIAIFLLFAGWSAAAQNVNSDPVNPAFSNAPASTVLLDGTPIRLRMTRTVSSADARAGDLVNLEVLDEVKVDDTVVVPKGSEGLAIVTGAEPKKLMGRGGKLDISIDSVKLVDGQKVPLRAVGQAAGNSNPTSIVSALSAGNKSSAPLVFVRGKDIAIPRGTEIVGYVNGNVSLDLPSLQPASLEAKNAAATLANSASELNISTVPDTAEIQIDGKFVGTSPCDIVVRSGEHKISVRLAGFKIWHKTVSASGEKLSFKIRLEQDGLYGSTVSSCSGPDCSDMSLGDVARQKRAAERSRVTPQ